MAAPATRSVPSIRNTSSAAARWMNTRHSSPEAGPNKHTRLSDVEHHVLPLRHRAYDAAIARGKPGVRHGRGDLVEKLSVGFHFDKSDPLDNS